MPTAAPGSAPAGVGRLDSLTGVRMLAALGVFCLHASGAGPPWVRAIVAPGNTGVSLFFVLSGFVLAWTSRPDDRVRDFYRRRVARVVPNHLFTWCVVAALVLSAAGTHGAPSPGGALASLVLVQAWVPDQDVVLALNGPSWTLSCEAFFYLAFPVLLPVLVRLRSERRTALVLLLAAALPLWVGVCSSFTDGDRLVWLTANLPPVRLVEFVVGMLIGLEVRAGRWDRTSVPLAAGLVAAALVVTAVLPEPYGTASVTLLPFAALLAALAHADLRRVRSPLRIGWVVRLGVWSYAFYLVHEPVIRVVRRLLPGVPWWSTAALALLGAVAAAAALHEVFERPVERALRPSPQLPLRATDGLGGA